MLKGVQMYVSIDPSDPETNKEIWEMHSDDAARKEGSGTGLVLKNPSGDKIMYALRFHFQVSNNEAKYKALLAGLRLE